MFTADWLDVIFVHFRISPEKLAPLVPLPLDLFGSPTASPRWSARAPTGCRTGSGG
jgi:hypothetical protein